MKLSPRTIFFLGACIFVIFVSYGYTRYKPNSTETKLLHDNRDALNTEGDKLNAAKKRVLHAQQAVDAEAMKWQSIVQVDTPAASLAQGGVDIGQNAWQLVVDTSKFRNSIQRAVNQQIKKGGVKVIAGPQIPLPPDTASTVLSEYYNYPAIPFPVVIFDLGTIQVEGTYAQICQNVRSYSNMPHYLAVADGLRLDGTSPILHGTYNLSIVGYIRGNHIFASVPEAAAATAAGGGGGFAGAGGPGLPSKGGGKGALRPGLGK